MPNSPLSNLMGCHFACERLESMQDMIDKALMTDDRVDLFGSTRKRSLKGQYYETTF